MSFNCVKADSEPDDDQQGIIRDNKPFTGVHWGKRSGGKNQVKTRFRWTFSSIIRDDGQRAQLTQFGLVLPLPLFICEAGLVYLFRQVTEDLVHLCKVYHLGERIKESEKDGKEK